MPALFPVDINRGLGEPELHTIQVLGTIKYRKPGRLPKFKRISLVSVTPWGTLSLGSRGEAAGSREIPWGKRTLRRQELRFSVIGSSPVPFWAPAVTPLCMPCNSFPPYPEGGFQLLFQVEDQVGVGIVLLTQHSQIPQGILDPGDTKGQ